MGRRKVSLKFISDKKSRQTSFLKRSKELQKKAHELQEIGSIDTLLICYDERGLLKSWPVAPPDIHRIISRYYSIGEAQRKRYTRSLLDFCGNKGNKSKQEQSSPTWDGQLDGLLEKIQEEIAAIDDKIHLVRKKMESIKRSTNQSELVIPHPQSGQSNISCAPTFDFNDPVSIDYNSSSIYQHDDMGIPYPCSPMSMQITDFPDFSTFTDDFLGDINLSNPPVFDDSDWWKMEYPCSPMSMQITEFPDVSTFTDDFLGDSNLSNPPVFDDSDWWEMEHSDNAIDNNNDGLCSSQVGAPDMVGSGDPSALQLPNVSPTSKSTPESFRGQMRNT